MRKAGGAIKRAAAKISEAITKPSKTGPKETPAGVDDGRELSALLEKIQTYINTFISPYERGIAQDAALAAEDHKKVRIDGTRIIRAAERAYRRLCKAYRPGIAAALIVDAMTEIFDEGKLEDELQYLVWAIYEDKRYRIGIDRTVDQIDTLQNVIDAVEALS